MKTLKQHLQEEWIKKFGYESNTEWTAEIKAVKEWLQEHQKINPKGTIYYETIQYLIEKLEQTQTINYLRNYNKCQIGKCKGQIEYQICKKMQEKKQCPKQ